MTVLPGVRVGPLDPDRTAEFGQVSGKTSARTLIRVHAAMNPPQLTGPLSRKRQADRSDALVAEEVTQAAIASIEDAGEDVPDGFEVSGSAVRGSDDAPRQQVVTYTYPLPSGRSGKGVLPYNGDVLPKSVEAGNLAVELKRAREMGMLLGPSLAQRATVDPKSEAEAADLRDENESLKSELDDLRERVAAFESQAQTPAQEAAAAGTDAAPVAPSEPFSGYDAANADTIKRTLAETTEDEQADLARAILSYEAVNANRSGVKAAAEKAIDDAAARKQAADTQATADGS